MTFNPQFGLTSKETFSYTGDAIYNNPSLQGIVAGYVTLLSTDTGVTYLYNSSWKPVNSWSFSNNLYDSTTVTGSFLTYSETAISGSAVSQSGNQGILNNIRAWNIITDYPEYDTGQSKFKKHRQVGLYLGERSPNTVYADSINSGSQAFTIEFDITSSESYSGFQGLTGSTSALTGILNHGLYIQTTTKWDFIECTPEGIRSLNHPDISIPINLLNPKRIRIGVRDSDLFLATDDGQAVYALGKFDTPHPSAPVNPLLYFGAPFLGVYSGDSTAFTVTHGATGFSSYAFYGNTVWDNIRILTGQLALYYNTGSNPIYSTGVASMTTAPFDPSISLSSFSRAIIEYVPYKGGVTEVYAQYSGINGWESSNTSVVLSHNNSVATLDLTDVPIFSYPRTNQGIDYVTNPIRFKIDQYSYDGLGLPPAVESISIYADKEQYKIDLLPNWKPYNLSTKISIGIDTGNFILQDPQPDVWTSFLFNTPNETTILGSSNSNGYYTDESKHQLPLMFSGSGEFIPGGYYGQCYKNHIIVSGSAITGSEASSVFGSSSVSNYFPNPLFSLNFRPITSSEILAFGGTTLNGFLASYAHIPTGYTGIHRIDYSKEVVYRLDTQAEYNRRNQFLGNTLEEQTDYVQRVYVYSNADSLTLDRAAGIELYVPSGIASGELVVGFDINITTGSYLEFYSTGAKSPFKSTIIAGDSAREYIRLEIPVTNTGYDSLRLGFVRPLGYPSDELEFYLDNVTVSNVNKSYLYFTGMTGYLHQSGLITDAYNASLPVPHKASTVIYGDILLESYPINTTGTFVKLTGSSCGIDLQILPNGKLSVTASHVSDAWSTGQNLYHQTLPNIHLESKDKIPLGTWTNIGFVHDVHNFDKLGNLQYSGNQFPLNFAACNRAYLTFDGDIQASVDLMTGWTSKIYNSDAAPYSSYIPLTGNITGYVASGIMCRVDAVHISRPPIANVESELSIKGSRNLPYFVPDYLYKAGHTGNNILLSNNSVYGNDMFIGMLYNLSSPYLTNWDRGPMANHLMFYGNRTLEPNNPYDIDGVYSTRFNTGYAIVPYSSAVDRLINTTGQLGIVSSSGYVQGHNNGEIRLNGWIYPRETGVFFTCYQNTGLPNGNRFDLEVGSHIIYNKYNASTVKVVSVTGSPLELNSWNYINFSLEKNNTNPHLADGNTGYAKVGFQMESTGYFWDSTGVDHSFKYTNNSQFRLGNIDCNLFNIALYFPHSGDQNFVITGIETSIDKGGRHQALLDGSSLFTGSVSWTNYYNGEFTSPSSSTIGQKFYSVALYNSYDDSPKLNGILLYDNKPFKEVNSYHIRYDTAPLERVFGATDSPIRLGTIVPDNAINIARFSSPEYSVDSAINVIDLSDSNVDNIVTYMGGSYDLRPSIIQTSELTSYQNINEPIYTGAVDITFSGQVISSDISFTTLYVPDNNGYFGVPLTQYYLLGRGKNLFKLDNAEPHATGQISDFNSLNAQSYVANLERIKRSIKFKDRSGKDITSEIPFDILSSPYKPDSLVSATMDNSNISLDNIGSYEYATGKLSNGLFSVVLLTNIERDDTVFVYYPGYDPYLGKDLYNHKEVVNPQPIFREKHISEEASIGKFDLNLNSNNYYDLTIYGILSGYSDKL